MLRSTMVVEHVRRRFDQRVGYGYESQSRLRGEHSKEKVNANGLPDAV